MRIFRFFTTLLIVLCGAAAAVATEWHPDSVLGEGFEMRSVTHPDDYSGNVRSTIIRHRSDCGDSTAVLYIHGYNDYFFQDEEAERIADSCYHFYAVDLRKYGRSLQPGQEPYELRDISEYYADIDSAMAAMRDDGIKDVVLMGHSTGGLVSSAYMSEHPDTMVRALILNSPFLDWNMNAFMRKVATPFVGFLGKIAPRMKISQGSGESPYGQSLLRGRHGEWDFNTRWKTIVPRKVEASWIGAITRAQKRVRKGRIQVPVLLMHSDSSAYGDRWTPQFQSADGVLNIEHMKKHGPKLGQDVELTEIPDGMHDLFLSAPAAREKAYKKNVQLAKKENKPMSKAALKKEFAGMTREQIIQIVLDAYAARKEVREYFDFFIDPDVDKLMEKTIARIDKELMRGKHGRSTSRITLVRRAIKDFASFDPGAEYVMRVMLETLRHILEREKYIYFKESFEKGTHKLVSDIIAYADAHAMVQNTMSSLHDMARDMQLGTASFRNRLLGRFMGIS